MARREELGEWMMLRVRSSRYSDMVMLANLRTAALALQFANPLPHNTLTAHSALTEPRDANAARSQATRNAVGAERAGGVGYSKTGAVVFVLAI
jgi:hypothetical protein